MKPLQQKKRTNGEINENFEFSPPTVCQRFATQLKHLVPRRSMTARSCFTSADKTHQIQEPGQQQENRGRTLENVVNAMVDRG